MKRKKTKRHFNDRMPSLYDRDGVTNAKCTDIKKYLVSSVNVSVNVALLNKHINACEEFELDESMENNVSLGSLGSHVLACDGPPPIRPARWRQSFGRRLSAVIS